MNSENTLSDFFRNLTGPRVAFIVFIAAGGYFLWTEHQAHILIALPYLILLLCPLMHIFMHRHHGSHGNGTKTDNHEDHSHL